jgi:DNA end-binding protein Ku
MARQLIANLTAPFSPDKYTDEYRAALLEIIDGKIKGEEVFIASSPEKGEVIDLAEALKASVEATRRGASKKAAGDKKKKTGAGAR